MEDSFANNSSASESGGAGGEIQKSSLFSSAGIPPPDSSLSSDSGANQLNVLSSFLNGSREISNFQPHFTDLLKNSYPIITNDNSQQPKSVDGVVPESSSSSSTSSHTSTTNMPTTSGDSHANNKRKMADVLEDKDPVADDKKAIKKQRRLAKNREAAQLFRQRQKEYISNLENRAQQLVLLNNEANARAELVASENKLMKEQLTYLRNFMKQAVSFSMPYGALPGTSSSSPSPTSPAGLVPTNPFLGGLVPSPQLGVDAMGNFIDSLHTGGSGGVGLPSSIPLPDGTSISFNLVPSNSGPHHPPFLSFLPLSAPQSGGAPGSPLTHFSPTASNVPTTPNFPSHAHAHVVPDVPHHTLSHHHVGIASGSDKGELSPD